MKICTNINFNFFYGRFFPQKSKPATALPDPAENARNNKSEAEGMVNTDVNDAEQGENSESNRI